MTHKNDETSGGTENEVCLRQYLEEIRKTWPEPEAVSDEQLRELMKGEGATRREANTRTYRIGRNLAARRKGVAYGHKRAWLEKEMAKFGLSDRALQLYMQVARGLDSCSATAVRISILDSPLRDIPSLLRVASGKEGASKKDVTGTPEDQATVWRRKLQRLVNEAQENTNLRQKALPILKDTLKAYSDRAQSDRVNHHPERAFLLTKKSLSLALSRLVSFGADAQIALRVAKFGEHGELEILTGNQRAILEVVVPAVVGAKAPEIVVVPHKVLVTLLKSIRTSSGTLEFVKTDDDKIVVYYARGTTPLGNSSTVTMPDWPPVPEESEDDLVWPSRDLETVLTAGTAIRDAHSKFDPRHTPAVAVIAGSLEARIKGNLPLIFGPTGGPLNTVINSKQANAVRRLLVHQPSAIVRRACDHLSIQGTDCFARINSPKLEAPLVVHSTPGSVGQSIVVPAEAIRTGLPGLRPNSGSALDHWLRIHLPSQNVAFLQKVDVDTGNLANWDVPVVGRGGSTELQHWSVFLWHPVVAAMLTAWPHYLVQIDRRPLPSGEVVVLSAPDGSLSQIQVVLPEPPKEVRLCPAWTS